MTAARLRLVIDTATRQSTVALGDGPDLLAQSTRTSEHRHGSVLLDQVAEVLSGAGADRRSIEAIGVGTGPGSFTGLRVGLATAKTLAYAIGVPLVGIPTGDAIAHAVAGADTGGPAPGGLVVILPAGARDHYVAIVGEAPRLVGPGMDLRGAAGQRLAVAVDLPDAVLDAAAAERGARGLQGLAAALLELLDERLASGPPDDIASLVPAYVALPRGITSFTEELAWLPDLR